MAPQFLCALAKIHKFTNSQIQFLFSEKKKKKKKRDQSVCCPKSKKNLKSVTLIVISFSQFRLPVLYTIIYIINPLCPGIHPRETSPPLLFPNDIPSASTKNVSSSNIPQRDERGSRPSFLHAIKRPSSVKWYPAIPSSPRPHRRPQWPSSHPPRHMALLNLQAHGLALGIRRPLHPLASPRPLLALLPARFRTNPTRPTARLKITSPILFFCFLFFSFGQHAGSRLPLEPFSEIRWGHCNSFYAQLRPVGAWLPPLPFPLPSSGVTYSVSLG